MILPASRGATREATIPKSGWNWSNNSASVPLLAPKGEPAIKPTHRAAAELKALQQLGDAAGWPPEAYAAIAHWHDRWRPDEPALGHRWRRWAGCGVTGQPRSGSGSSRIGGDQALLPHRDARAAAAVANAALLPGGVNALL